MVEYQSTIFKWTIKQDEKNFHYWEWNGIILSRLVSIFLIIIYYYPGRRVDNSNINVYSVQ